MERIHNKVVFRVVVAHWRVLFLIVTFLAVLAAPGAGYRPRPAHAAAQDTIADRVFGQGGSFAGTTCNQGNGPDASTLCGPSGVALDSSRNLYIADWGNDRVLEYNSPLGPSHVFNMVFGTCAGGFTGWSCTNPSAESLVDAPGVALDGSGNMYVADFTNNRVLEYDWPLSSGAAATRVFGQGGSFTSNGCNNGGVSASTLCQPTGVAVDSSGNVYVADLSNNRVLEYSNPLATDTVADQVFGQGGSFTTNVPNNGGPPSAAGLNFPSGVAVDASGNLYVADAANNRVLEYDTPLTTNTVADRVFGQSGSFTTDTCNNGGISASSLCASFGVAVDYTGNLWVADSRSFTNVVVGNNRVLEYDSPLTTNTVADRVLGQSNFSSNSCNQGTTPSASTLCGPDGVAVDNVGNVYVADQNNHRVLEYDYPLPPADLDGDGVPDPLDVCPGTAPGATVDANGCSQAQVDTDLDGVCSPGQSSPTWCTGSDSCPDTAPGAAVDANGCAQVQVDRDLDGACDPGWTSSWCTGTDNCPDWYNPAQALPPWPVPAKDPDCDGFGRVESYVGTNGALHCGVNAWPADINNDTFSDISDIVFLTGNFGAAVPPAPARYDIAPDPQAAVGNRFVDITDVSKMASFFGFSCTP